MSNLFAERLKSIPIITSGDPPDPSRNAIKHGACAVNTLILESESHQDYLALEKRVFVGFGAQCEGRNVCPAEAEIIRAAARAEWFFLRAERNYAEVEANMTNAAPNVLTWGDDHHFVLGRFLRYRTANFNLMMKARKAVDDFRKARALEKSTEQKMRHETEKLAIVKDKWEIYRLKNAERRAPKPGSGPPAC